MKLRPNALLGCLCSLFFAYAAGGCSGSGNNGKCVIGTDSCACYSNSTCDPGLECSAATNTCSASANIGNCTVGTDSCACYSNSTCDPGLECSAATTLCSAAGASTGGTSSGAAGAAGVGGGEAAAGTPSNGGGVTGGIADSSGGVTDSSGGATATGGQDPSGGTDASGGASEAGGTTGLGGSSNGVGVNLVTNGDFANQASSWRITDSTTAETNAFTIVAGALCVSGSSGSSFSIGWPADASDAISVETGAAYTFSFRMRGDFVSLEAKVGGVYDPWPTVFSEGSLSTVSAWTTISRTFTPDSDEAAAGLVFNVYFDAGAGQLCVDDVSLLKD